MMIKKYIVENSNKETILKFMSDNELILHKDILKAIDYCFDNNKDSIEAFIIEPSTNSYFVYKEKFEDYIKRCIQIFEKYEEYEMCAKTIKIQNKIKKGV